MHAYLQARAPCCAVTGSEKKEGGQQMIEEACLPWTPLPERFSGSWQVDVVHVAEADSADIRPFETLAIAVAAYAEPTATYGNQAPRRCRLAHRLSQVRSLSEVDYGLCPGQPADRS